MSETIIKVEHARKTYRDYKSNFQKLRHMIIMSGAGEKNRILQDVSFEIKKGEKVAIISNPGEGKSTVMRIIAGIIKVEAGTVETKGSPTILFDYRRGFEPTLTGHDNYEMQARLLGWSGEKIKENEDKVFKFAGLTEYKEMPLRSYPKGGLMRLGFAIATDDDPEFLLFDERMTFGNVRINRKFLSRMSRVTKNPEMTLVMAANDPRIAKELCDRGIVIMDGKVAFDGSCEEALKFLKEHAPAKRRKKAANEESPSEPEPVMDDDGLDDMQ